MDIKRTYTVILAVFLLALGGCAVMPQNPSETVYSAHYMYVLVGNTASTAYKQGSITKAEYQDIWDYMQSVRPKIDMAREIVNSGGSVNSDTLQTIQMINSVLIQLQKELMEANLNDHNSTNS